MRDVISSIVSAVKNAPVNLISIEKLNFLLMRASKSNIAKIIFNPVTLVRMTMLTASDGAIGDEFGISVSLNGDYAVVGAHHAVVGVNQDQGSVYVFHSTDTVWSQQAKLVASDGAAGDYFGQSVSLSGDYALIGANTDSPYSNQGSVYVFHRSGTAWNQHVKLAASDGAAGDGFGCSVSLDDDYALIGAMYVDIGANANQGSAYIFFRSGTSWGQQAKLTASDGSANDQLGYYVSMNGYSSLISALYCLVYMPDGQSYAFMKIGTSWDNQVKLSTNGIDDDIQKHISSFGDYCLVGDTEDYNGLGSATMLRRAGK